MSYILDALRRADSEKAPGTVPGLHSQPTAASATPVPRRRRTRPLVWILGGGAIGLLATLTLWFVTRPPSTPLATVGTPAPVANSPAPAANPGAQPAAPAASAPAASPTAPVVSQPAAPAEPVGGATDSARAGTVDPMTPVAPPAPWPSPKAAGANTAAAAPGAATAKQPPAKADKAAAQPPVVPIVLRDELPANLKAELPPLAVGGSMYSSVAANRTLILDGRLVRENERLTPELVLEEIRLKSAVLRYKGQRFEIRY